MNYYNSETLLEQQQEIEKLKEQNAALAAQVEALLAHGSALATAASMATGALPIGSAVTESCVEAVKRFNAAKAEKPQHHLRQVLADAGRKAHFDGYMLGYEHAMSNKEKCEPAVYAAEYHASILAGKE